MSDKNFTTRGNEPIEARIVAWVLGEASAFEADELRRLCEEQPELAVFKRRIEAVHGLATEAHSHKDDANWKLPSKKRSAIEELIGNQEPAVVDLEREFRIGRSGRRALLAIAACLVLTLVMAGLMAPVMLTQIQHGLAFDHEDESMHPDVEGAQGLLEFDAMKQEKSSDGYVLGGKERGRMVPLSSVAGELPAEQIEGTPKPIQLPKLVDPSQSPAMKNFDKQSGPDFEPLGLAPPMAGGFASWNANSTTILPDDGAMRFADEAQALPAPSVTYNYASEESLGGLAGGGARGNEPMPAAEAMLDAETNGAFTRGTAEKAPKTPASDHFFGDADLSDSKHRHDLAGDQSGRRGNSPVPGALEDAEQMDPGLSEESKSRVQARMEAETGKALRQTQSGFKLGVDEYKDQLSKPDAPASAQWELAQRRSKGKGESMREGREMLLEKKLLESTQLELDEVSVADQIKEELSPEPKKRPVPTGEEIAAAQDPYSTFSLNISDASFRVAQAALARGEMPDPAGIKVEQFYNAVDYGDPAPAAGQPVISNIEQAAHPVIPGRNLVRIAIKTASEGRSEGQPLRLTLLIDQSGSMAREDRREAMVEALEGLRGLLKENDQVNVIGFARTPRLLAEAVRGNQGQLAQLVNIEANEGGTNLEEAIKLGEQLAERHQLEGAQNRMVLFTDGAANLGDADPDSLAEKIKDMRQKGIAFDIAGIVADGLNDELLGEMARHGNGRYYVVGKGEKDRFAQQLAGAFRPAAENVKVQVHFNPERVGRYKLIGFEKDRLNKEDFRNDAVDAAELAAEEAGVAIYQVETLPEGEGEIGEVSVRFRDVASGDMVERSWTIAHEIATPAIDQARPSMQLATLAMLAGEKLRGGPLSDAINFNEMGEVIARVNQHFKGDPKAAEMLEMIEQLK